MKSTKILALVLCLALTASLLSGCKSGEENREPTVAERYEQAIALLQTNQFTAAADAFETLGHYSDSAQCAMYCRALDSAGKGVWSTVIATLTTLDDFRDSRILSVYYQARALEDAECYEEAEAAYAGLTQYGDVSARLAALPGLILAREYKAADALEQSGKLEDAMKAFQALGEYSDSPMRAAKIQEALDQIALDRLEADYLAAASLEKVDDIVGAYRAFTALGTYKDSADRAAALKPEADYRSAFASAEEGNYSQAQRLYANLGDYRDAPEKARLLLVYQKADSSGRGRLASGVYSYRLNSSYGFIDLNNNRDLAPRWKSLESFSADQLAIAGVDSGYTLINLRGQAVTEIYSTLGRRGQFYAAGKTRNWSTSYAILNRQGQMLSNGWTDIGVLSEGLAAVKRSADGLWGYVGADGDIVIEPRYAAARDFSEGTAAVKLNKQWYYIDRTNTAVLTLGTDITDAWGFSGGLALVQSGIHGYQVIGEDGALVLFKENIYQSAESRVDNGRYEEAIALFESLSGYADSDEQAVKAREQINQQVYARAEDYKASGMLEQAAETFEWLGDYSDAAVRAADIRETIRANAYAQAKAMADAGEPENAIAVYQSLGDYLDSAEQVVALRNGINQDILDRAEELFEDGRKMSALNLLLPIADWENTAARMAEMYESYLQDDIDAAELLESAEQYEGAIEKYRALAEEINTTKDYFEKLRQDPDQQDEFARLSQLYELISAIEVGNDTEERISAAAEKMHQRDYNKAAALEEAQQYEKAIAAFEALGDWGDAAERAAGARITLDDCSRDYDAADTLVQELKLEEAAAAFEALGAFRNAAERAAETRKMLDVYTQAYANAEALETEGRFDEAYSIFTALKAYRDSADRAVRVEEQAKEQANQRAYQAAEQLVQAQKYAEAVAAYQALGDWNDAAEQAKAVQDVLNEYLTDYAGAEALETDLRFEEAAAAFDSLGAFSDAAERAVTARNTLAHYQAVYDAADGMETEGLFEKAIETLETLTEWHDAPQRIEILRGKIRERDYQLAQTAVREERYDDALALLASVGDYQDSAALLAEARTGQSYQKALQTALSGAIKEAYDAFKALGSYRDSAEKVTLLGNLTRAGKTTQITEGVLIYEFHDLWGLANLKANVMVPAKYTTITYEAGKEYRDLELLLVFVKGATEDKDAYGYMNLRGEEVVPCEYWSVSDFDEEGRCTVATANTVGSYCRLYFGIRACDGKIITDAQWRVLGNSYNAQTVHSYDVGSWNYNYYGGWYISGYRVVIPAYSNGRVKVQDNTSKALWGFIDENGQPLGDGVKWTDIGDFSDGMAMVKLNNKYGFIDTNGRQVGEVRWDTVNPFSNGYAAVRENGLWGFIDKTNSLVIPCQYAEVNAFDAEGHCDVKKTDGTWVVIDTSGEDAFFGK